MPRYDGPAVLVTPDGVEHPVQVQVDITPPRWEGDIHGDAGALWDAFDASQPVELRAEDGTSGRVIITSVAEGSGRLTGSGAPPTAWLI